MLDAGCWMLGSRSSIQHPASSIYFMLSSIAQLNKLRRMGLREIQVRSRQELNKLGERLRSNRVAEMSDAALRREFVSSARNGSGSGTAELILERLRQSATAGITPSTWPHWFPSFAERAEIVAIMESRFAAERREIIRRAERAAEGRFDLLGLADLSFGNPIDWHLDPTSGKRTPLIHWSDLDYLDPLDGGDQKVLWEVNRHAHFVTFGQAYWLTGDERFVDALIDQASSWMDSNPPTLGINWASSLEVAFRAIAWLWGLHLCAHSPRLGSSFTTRLIKYLIAHGRHIESYLSHYYSPNTHLTGEALGLFYLGVALPELRRANVWRKSGISILIEQLSAQVRGDGVYFEQTSYYHRYTTDFYTHLLILARTCDANLRGEVGERLTLLFEHLMWITRPDGSSPLFGDDDGGRLITLGARASNDFRDTLATGAALFHRGDWKWVAGPPAVETLWLLGPKGLADYERLEADPPKDDARAFDEGGYFIARDGWSGSAGYLFLDCGPHGGLAGCGHSHADALAIEFAAGGRTWLVDPGTFVYDADLNIRDEFRSTESHNTVTVDGQSQSVPAGPFGWSRIARCRLIEFYVSERGAYIEGEHDGYHRLSDPVKHTRAVLFVKADAKRATPAYLVVHDSFTARERHQYEINFHFALECTAVAAGNRIDASGPGGGVLTICLLGGPKARARVKEGWVSTCYAQREKAPVAVFEVEGRGPREFVTLIFPDTPDRTEQIAGQLAGHLEAGSPKEFFKLLLSGKGIRN
jgi:hypothetical protein